MSVRVIAWVWEYAEVSSGTLLVLLALADFAHDDGGGAYPSMDTLAKKARLKLRHTQAVVKKLDALGYIHVAYGQGPHGVNLYTVLMTLPLGAEVYPAKIAGHVEGDTEGVQSVAKGDAPDNTTPLQSTASNPSSETSSYEPSGESSLAITVPTWWITLGKDPRWGEVVDDDYIRDVDSFFGHLDLAFQARKCFQWLKDTTKGKARKDVRRTWLNWMEKEGKKAEGAKEPTVGQISTVGFSSLDLSLIEDVEGAVAIWKQAAPTLMDTIPRASFTTWFSDVGSLGFIGGNLVMKVPSDFVAQYIERRLMRLLEAACGCPVELYVDPKAGG